MAEPAKEDTVKLKFTLEGLKQLEYVLESHGYALKYSARDDTMSVVALGSRRRRGRRDDGGQAGAG